MCEQTDSVIADRSCAAIYHRRLPLIGNAEVSSRVFPEDDAVDAIGGQGKIMKADTGGIGQSVSQRRSYRVDRRFAHALGAQRAKDIRCPGKVDLAAWDVGISRDAIVPERRIDYPSLLVENHFFVKGPSQSLGNRAFDLAPELLRIDRDPGIGCMNALEDLDFPGNTMDRDPKTMHIKCDGARRSIGLAHDL